MKPYAEAPAPALPWSSGRRDLVRSAGIGAAGQGLNFLAMLLPLLLSEQQEVVNVVLAAGIANCLISFSVLALPMVYPSTESDADASRELHVALIFHAMFSLFVMVVGVCLLSSQITGPMMCFAAGILLFQGVDTILVAWLVRRSETHGIRRNRFRYGVSNLVLTSLAATFWHDPWALCVAALATYLVAAIWIASSYRAALVAETREWRRLSVAELVGAVCSSVPTALSYSLNAVTNQSGSFSLFTLGPLSAIWAAFNRICGGFGTVSRQLLAPSYDARISRVVRSGDGRGITPAIRTGVLAGVLLAVVSVGGSCGLFLLLGYYDPLTQADIVTITLCGVGFWGSSLVMSTIGKSLTLLRSPRLRWVWDATRFVAFALAMLLLRGTASLVVLSVLAAGFNVAYLILTITAKNRLVQSFTSDAATYTASSAATC